MPGLCRPQGEVAEHPGQQDAQAGAQHDAQALPRIDGLRRGPQGVQQRKNTVGQQGG